MSQEHLEWKWKDPDPDTYGVLLSDRIQYYAENMHLIEPFDPENLGPATYTLHASRDYWHNDKSQQPNEKDEIIIPQNGLIYIRIRERLNLPYYMVAIHDLRVKDVYRGFLAGRSVLVDPGYAGHINYPLYNFTDEPKTIKVGDRMTTICFVKTTQFGTHEFWKNRRGISSIEELKGLYVEGVDGNRCRVKFPLPDRPIHKYWNPGESHKSSVEMLQVALAELKQTVSQTLAKYRKWGIISIIIVIVAIFTAVLTHCHWYTNNMIDVQKGISNVSSCVDELRNELERVRGEHADRMTHEPEATDHVPTEPSVGKE